LKSLTLILGTHRSGTSLLTIGLQAAGLGLGVFSDIRDVDNPEGYGEHPSIRTFNDRLLEHLGVSWDNWGFRSTQVGLDSPAFNAWLDEAAELLVKCFPGPGPWALKDPRIATLLPFWERAVPHAGFALRRILIVRDPLEVAESQRQRAERRPGAFTVIDAPEPMAALWAVTMHEVLLALGDDDTWLVRHAELVRDPLATLRACADFLGASPVPGVLESFVAERVRPELYRARAPAELVGDVPWQRMARRLFASITTQYVGAGRLSRDAARILALSQKRLRWQMSTLSAAQQSIRCMQRNGRTAETALGDLRAAVWAAGGFVRTGESAMVQALGRAISERVQGRLPNELSLFVLMARVEERLGNFAEAEGWLQSAVATFPRHVLPGRLLEELGARRRSART